jgi:cell division protein ZapE
MISGIPVLNSELDDPARRFIALVDEFYDRHVKLILASAVPVELLYEGTRLAFEFERTRSRLAEMQSRQYLHLAHLS